MRTGGSIGADAPRLLGVPALDPRARLVTIGLMMLAAFVASVPIGLALALIACVTLWPLRRDPRRWRLVLGMAAVGLGSGFLLNVIFVRSGESWLRIPGAGLIVTGDGVAAGARLGLRMANLVLYGAVLVHALSADAAADSLVSLSRPLGRLLGRRVDTLLFQLRLSLRFVPILGAEARRIALSQRLRGLRLDRSPLGRARALAPLFVPIFVAALTRAHRLALVLVARGYRPGVQAPIGGRHRWRARDTVVVALSIVVGGWIVLEALR